MLDVISVSANDGLIWLTFHGELMQLISVDNIFVSYFEWNEISSSKVCEWCCIRCNDCSLSTIGFLLRSCSIVGFWVFTYVSEHIPFACWLHFAHANTLSRSLHPTCECALKKLPSSWTCFQEVAILEHACEHDIEKFESWSTGKCFLDKLTSWKYCCLNTKILYFICLFHHKL
jgi:hypothetical protein